MQGGRVYLLCPHTLRSYCTLRFTLLAALERYNTLIIIVHLLERYNTLIIIVHLLERYNTLIIIVHLLERYNTLIIIVHLLERYNTLVIIVHLLERYNTLIIIVHLFCILIILSWRKCERRLTVWYQMTLRFSTTCLQYHQFVWEISIRSLLHKIE